MAVEQPGGFDLPGMSVVGRFDESPPRLGRQHIFRQDRHPDLGIAGEQLLAGVDEG